MAKSFAIEHARFVALMCALCFLFSNNSTLRGDDISDGQRALRDSSDFPWYDSSTDSLKKIPIASAAPPVSRNRNSNWKTKPPKKTSSTNNNAGRTGSAAGNMDFSFVTLLLWVFVALILIAIIGALIWAFLRRESDDESELENLLADKRLKTDVERIENLPFDISKGTGTLFERAKAAYEAGKYREAMIFLYSHMLVQLDKHHWIHLSKSKTNRQYLNEIRGNRSLAKIFRTAMLNFEHTFFGFHDLKRASFEDCWNQMQEFESKLAKPPASGGSN